MPTTNRLTATLLALSLAAACGDNDKSSRTLEILMPDGEMPLCSRDDESTTAPGLQDSVTVRAIGFRQGDLVTLDIVTPQGAVDPQPAAVTMNNEIVFSNVTLPEGSVVLQARAGDVTSPTVVLTVDTAAPELQFIEPTPGANPERISRDDDLDTADLDIDFEVVVTSDVADGEELHLRATPPSGTEADLGPATVADGQGSWEVPFNEPGLWSLTVEGMNDCGNTGTQTVEVFVDLVAPECRITIIPEPLDITGVPLGVLNASNDPSPDPDFQAMVTVSSEPGATVTLFLDDVENASMIAGASGMVTFDLDLAEDTDLELRATCSDAGGNIVSSTPEHVLVDITPPGCMISDPNDGAVLTPADDVDDVDPDVDFDVVVTVDGGDVEGQPVNVDVDGTDIPGTVVGGSATARASKNSADPSVPITLTAQDRAGNLCTDTITVSVDLAGCPIEITGPTGTVFTDADPSAAGMQVDVTVANSDMDCNGRTVELTNCDVTGTVVGTLAAGAATIRATFCSADQCEQTRTCTATVTEAGSGIVTSDSATIVVDTLPPQVTMSIINPAVVCGSTITAASDIDGSTPGVQVQVRLLAAAPTRYFEVTPDTGPPAVMYPADVNGFATITIGSGQNTIVAFATDASGTGMSTPCTLRLSTLGVTITSPLNGQTLGAADGTVSGSDLVIQVCGTVTDGTATVNVSVDGGSPVAAIVTGTTWCASGVTVPAGGPHTVLASGMTPGGDNGQHSIVVFVDVQVPMPPTGFMIGQFDRRTTQIDFTEPADMGGGPVDRCVIKSSVTAIDDTNFEATPGGRTVNGTSPGAMHTETFTPMRIGPLGAHFWAVRCYDNADNPSTVVAGGPFELNLEQGAEMVPAAGGDQDYGAAMAAADLDADGVDDLVVGALRMNADGMPGLEGRVYIHMGAAGTGISSSPTYVIDTAVAGAARLGTAITRIDWNDDGFDDIAIGAPQAASLSGQVFIFLGADAGTTDMWEGAPATYTTAQAHVTISVAAEGGFTPTNAFAGQTLSTVDFDGDGGDDLAIGAPNYGGAKGGVIVLYGGSSATSISIPDTLDEAGAKAHFFSFTTVGSTPSYGTTIAALGAVSGAGDTREDLAIAPSADAVDGPDPVTSEDRVFVFYGRAQPVAKFEELSGILTAEEQILAEVEDDGVGNLPRNRYGQNLGSIQDHSGDGRRELVVSAAARGADRGRVYIVPIGDWTAGPQLVKSVGTASWGILEGTINSEFLGLTVANPAAAKVRADVDGDTIEDLLIGNSADSFSTARHLYVFFGGAGLSGLHDRSGAADVYTAPATWTTVTRTLWAGDLDDNGMEDMVWSDAATTTATTGAIQPLY